MAANKSEAFPVLERDGGMKRARRIRTVTTYAAVALLSFLSNTGTASASLAAGSAATGGTSWTVYHGNAEGNGVAPIVSSVNLSSPAWTSPALDGQLYGEPLVSGGHVIVATENDTVYALSAATGAVQWSTHLGTPVPSRVRSHAATSPPPSGSPARR